MQRQFRKQKIQPRLKGPGRWLGIASLSIGLSVAVALQIPRIRRIVEAGLSQASGWMRVEELVWREQDPGNLSHKVSVALLERKSGIRKGDELLKLDLAKIERELLEIPWLQSLEFQKRLPSTLIVHYVVRRAAALTPKNGELVVVARDGKEVGPGEASMDFPVVSGAAPYDLQLDWADTVSAALGEDLAEIHEVNLKEDRQAIVAWISLRFPSRAHKLRVISPATLSIEALTRLKKVAQYLINNNVLVSNIDLRLGKKVVVIVGKRP